MRHLLLVAGLVLAGLILPALAQGPSPGGPPAEQRVISVAPPGTPAFNQVTVGTNATLIRVANQNRATITLINHGTTNVFIGFTNAVTTSTGALLVGVPGQQLVISTRTDIWGIAAGSAQVVGLLEELR